MTKTSVLPDRLRVVAYIRMSTARQEDSPERQIAQIESHAKRCSYTIREVYCDLGVAGDDSERPGLLRLLADAMARKFDVILIDEPSRLSRSKPSRFIAEVIYPLENAEVSVESVSAGPLRWDDIGGLIMTEAPYHPSADPRGVWLNPRHVASLSRPLDLPSVLRNSLMRVSKFKGFKTAGKQPGKNSERRGKQHASTRRKVPSFIVG